MTPPTITRTSKSSQPPGRLPMLMNAFVWPGSGQFIHRRWLAGSACAAGFLVAAAFFFIAFFRLLAAYYGLWLHFDSNTPPEHPSFRGILVWFAVGIVLYVVALVDSYVTYIRVRSDWNARQRGAVNCEQ